jgi:serine/threonine-protein kinase
MNEMENDIIDESSSDSLPAAVEIAVENLIGAEIIDEQPFAGYEVTARIGQGIHSAVFKGSDTRLDRKVTIKVLVPDLENNADAVECYFNEARNVARLRHPKLVRGLDVGRSGNYFYFVSEYFRAESLEAKLRRLERGRLLEDESLDIVRQVAEALQCAFENGLVHRSVKPSNILLGADKEVKLCDLGVAREVAFASPEAAIASAPDCASPEQAEAELNIDIRSDLYSLGCCWYRMLTGNAPFKSPSPEVLLSKHISEEPVPPREENIRISAFTNNLVMWLLEKDLGNRPRTPQDFLNKLLTHPKLREVAAPQADATSAEPDQETGEVAEADGDIPVCDDDFEEE